MIYSALRDKDGERVRDPSRGWNLVLLSIAVSVDALAVGLSLGVLGVFVLHPAIVIGMVTGALSLIGLRIGQSVGRRFGGPVEITGGIVLFGIGLRILIQHLAG